MAMNPEELLSHADFVRSLARRLVGDQHLADDVSQEACAAALTHPPSTGVHLRAWLARVMVNFSRKHYRGEKRLKARERASVATSAEAAPSAAAIAAREEIRSLVVEAVQSLDEPWRSTILLRYYEDLPHRQVAERLGVPLETMRTRLKTGLRMLREHLDRLHHGEREKWRLALAPLAGIKTALPTAGVSTGALTGVAKTLLLGAKVKIAATIALALLTLFAAWSLFPDWQTGETEAAKESALTVAGGLEPGRIDSGIRPAAGDKGIEPDADSDKKEKIPAPSREVTWQGRLIEYDGLPRDGIAIDLKLVKASYPDEKPRKATTVRSADGGRFEFGGLVAGEFSVHLAFPSAPGREHRYKWGNITFEKPGVVEKDLLVTEGAGAIVAGVVVDEESKQPIRRPPPSSEPALNDTYVGLFNPDMEGETPITEIDCETGRFCFRNLPRMKFTTILMMGPFRKVLPSSIDTTENKVVDDLEITVPPLGRICILFSGFGREEIRSIDVTLEAGWGAPFPPIQLAMESQTYAIPEGKGVFVFKHETLGRITRSFEILRGHTTELVVSPADFGENPLEAVDVPVTLSLPDGSPLADATVVFQKKMDVPDLRNTRYRGATDSAGRLEIEGIEPGMWSVWCSFLPAEKFASLKSFPDMLRLDEDLRISTFHGISVPPDPESGSSIDLVLPAGTIRGILCDKRTSRPIDCSLPLTKWVMVNDPNSSFQVQGISFSHKGPGFELTGIAGGRYQLMVAAFGFEQYVSECFTLAEGQILDLDRIMLDSVGTAEIEVCDRVGNPLPFKTSWDGKSRSRSIFCLDGFPLAAGKNVLGNLPFSSIDVEIWARGFKSKTITLEITRSRRAKASVVLDRE
jgi:RNA polymerase sigma factor (sigma-70 family)